MSRLSVLLKLFIEYTTNVVHYTGRTNILRREMDSPRDRADKADPRPDGYFRLPPKLFELMLTSSDQQLLAAFQAYPSAVRLKPLVADYFIFQCDDLVEVAANLIVMCSATFEIGSCGPQYRLSTLNGTNTTALPIKALEKTLNNVNSGLLNHTPVTWFIFYFSIQFT